MPHQPQLHSPLIIALTRHYDELVERLRRRFGDKSFAQEVVNEACVQLLERPPNQVIHTPQAFLNHITQHLAIDHYRSQSTHAALISSEVEPERIVSSHSDYSPQEIAVAFRQRSERLLAAIEALPPRTRDVLILSKLYHLEQQEIAERLGISRGMVARQLARATTHLGPLLEFSAE